MSADDLRLRLTQLGLTPIGIDLQRMLDQMQDVEQQIILARGDGFAKASLPWLSTPDARETAQEGTAHVAP